MLFAFFVRSSQVSVINPEYNDTNAYEFPLIIIYRNVYSYPRQEEEEEEAIAKFIMIGSFLKAKIELLLKILGAHLQVKFFAIALIGLLINIARFWIDVKRGSPPSKVS